MWGRLVEENIWTWTGENYTNTSFIIRTTHQQYQSEQIKEDASDGTCSTHGDTENGNNLLTNKLHGAGYLKSWMSLSLSKNILLPLWNPNVHHHVYKGPLMDTILSQLNPVRHVDPYLPKVQLNVILPPTPRSSQWSLAFGPPNQNPVCLRATCPAHLNLLDLITLTIFGEEYRLWSSSSCNFLQDPSSSLLGPNVLLNPLFWREETTSEAYNYVEEQF
jgi:hypothetical protein